MTCAALRVSPAPTAATLTVRMCVGVCTVVVCVLFGCVRVCERERMRETGSFPAIHTAWGWAIRPITLRDLVNLRNVTVGFCTLPTVSLTSAGKACVSSRWRHIGNDDVHIVWSEHTEEYKVQQLPTKFGRVTLVLYPLRNGMIRIQVIQKQALRVWPGPVIDGSVVDRVSAAPMVRLTALNVSREIRAEASLSPHYQIRKDYLQRIVALKSVSPFEDDMGSLVNGRSKAANARARTTPSSTPTAVSGQ
eukprot:m.1572014 g.1572014  ORF g.1572014 m.1572014 type:complete len:249 (+) comp25302_c0_seq8:7605-8351(+)